MTEGPWTVGGAIAAGVAALAGIISALYQFVIEPKIRRRTLRKPCAAWFAISPLRPRNYAVRDGRDHHLCELTLAPNADYEIEILYKPRLTFDISQLYFGCGAQDYKDIDTKPTIEAYCMPLNERGTTEESPETHPDTNQIDRHKFYHLIKQRTMTRSEMHSVGCKIKTRKVGIYEFRLFFVGEETGTTTNRLFIRVEDPPTTKMKCVLPEHRQENCFVQPAMR